MELMRVKENQIFGTSEEYAVPTLRVVITYYENKEDEIIEVPYYTGSFKSIPSAKKLNIKAKRLSKERVIWPDEYLEIKKLANEAIKEYEEIIAKEAEEERIAKEKAEAAEAVRIASKEAKEEFVNAKKDAKKAYKDKLASIKGVKEETSEAEEVNPDQLSDEELTELALTAVNPETLEDETVDDKEVEFLEEPEQIVIDKETKKPKKIKVDKKAFVLGGALAAVGIIWLVSRQSCKLNNTKNALKDAALDKNSTNIETSVKNIPEVSINKDEDSYFVETTAPTEEEKQAFVEDATNAKLTYDQVIEEAAKLDNDLDTALSYGTEKVDVDGEDTLTFYSVLNYENLDRETLKQLFDNGMLPDSQDKIIMANWGGSYSYANACHNYMVENGPTVELSKFVFDEEHRAQLKKWEDMMTVIKQLPNCKMTTVKQTEEQQEEVKNIIQNLIDFYHDNDNASLGKYKDTPNGMRDVLKTLLQYVLNALCDKGYISAEDVNKYSVDFDLNDNTPLANTANGMLEQGCASRTR